MREFLPFIIAGVVSGSVYGLAGTGLVLNYKTSGIFNFAYGGIATIAAFLFYSLHDQFGIAWPLAALLCIVVLGVGIGIAMELFARRLILTSVARQIAGTVGLMIAIEAVFTLIYGQTPLLIPPFLPTKSFLVDGVAITTDQVIIIVIGLLVTFVLYAYLRYSTSGTAMRAVADNPDLLSLSQFNPDSIRRGAWIIGCVLATLSGVLIAPSLALTPEQLTLLVVQAFGAAAIGRFASLPGTYVGGLCIGVLSALCTKWVGSDQTLAGLASSVPFIVLFVLLVVIPRNRWRLAKLRKLPHALVVVPRASIRTQAIMAAPLFAILMLVPFLVGSSHIIVWGQGLTFIILFASLALLVRVAGQISLCHVTFMAIGAACFAHLAGSLHVPWFLALVCAALVVVPIGAALAVPASRLPVLFLGLATLGFGLVVQQIFYPTSLLFTPFVGGLSVGRPSIGGLSLASDMRYYYLLLGFTVLTVLAVLVLIRTRFGRLLAGLSDSPLALSSLGADERVTRTFVFCISAFFAGLSGALYAGLLGNVDATTFDPMQSLTYLVVIVIVLGDPLWASVAAAVGIGIIPGYVQSGNITEYLQLIFGGFAIIVAATKGIPSVPGRFGALMNRLSGPLPASVVVPSVGAGAPPAVAPTKGRDLEIRHLAVSFGGSKAVSDVSLKARQQRITGLIGPNGAGKTTTFNVCSGLIKPTSGGVLFGGRDVTRLGTARRARMGLGRTFQQTELFPSLTVQENLLLGCEAPAAGAKPWSQIVSSRSARLRFVSVIESVASLCGIEALLRIKAGALSTGQRRLVEIARAVSSSADLVLLDEPSAGLDSAESLQLGSVLLRLRRERGMGVLLVEHDMELVMDVCDYIYVLDFGQLIFEGTPSEVQASPTVRLAYLGEPLEAKLDASATTLSGGMVQL